MNPEDQKIGRGELQQFFGGEIPFGKEIGFYLDESSDQHIGSIWTEGIALTTVEQQKQKGEPSDIRILARARQLGCILITNDPDFEEIHRLVRSIEGCHHPGIILIKTRTAKANSSIVIDRIVRLAEQSEYTPDALQDELLTV